MRLICRITGKDRSRFKCKSRVRYREGVAYGGKNMLSVRCMGRRSKDGGNSKGRGKIWDRVMGRC